jgi:hypothetical protein
MDQIQEKMVIIETSFLKNQQIAHAALSFIRKLENQIHEQKALLEAAGLSPYIEGCNHEGWGAKLPEGVISNAVIETMINNTAHLSLHSRYRLKSKFMARPPYHINVFNHPALFLEFDKKLSELRKTERISAITWIKTAEINSRLEYRQKNYTKVPKMLRLTVTPDISKIQALAQFKSHRAFEELNLLEVTLGYLASKTPPKRLLGQIISQTWERQYSKAYEHLAINKDHRTRHRYGLENITTFDFSCEFFKLKAYRTAADKITLTDEARALINQYEESMEVTSPRSIWLQEKKEAAK